MLQKSWIRYAFFFFLVLIASPDLNAEDLDLPKTSVGHQSVLSLTKEQALGAQIMRHLEAENQVTPDETVNAYLQGLGKKIAQVAPSTGFDIRLFGIHDGTINAFTFFGGYIGVHEGLLLAVNNEEALIAVLAHEYSHITQRHLARMLENQRRLMPLTIAQMLGALVLGTVTSAEVGMHASMAIANMHFHNMLAFSRHHELEADRFGMDILAKLGYDPRALARVFDLFHQNSRYSEKPPEYLQTHPLNERRIADAENRLSAYPKHPVKVPLSLDYQWAAARTRVALGARQRKTLIGKVKEILKDSHLKQDERAGLRYTEALLLMQALKWDEAKTILTELNQRYPRAWVPELSLAETEYALGEKTQAIMRLNRLLEQHREAYPIVLIYAEYLIREKDGALAQFWLKQYVDHFPWSLKYFQLVAQAARLCGDFPSIHEAQAEWHVIRGEFKAARLQTELALDKINPDLDILERHRIELIKQRIERLEKESA